ncbi:hypothetical protein BH10PSE1_BH10PSE1_11180 [soil metagenome]
MDVSPHIKSEGCLLYDSIQICFQKMCSKHSIKAWRSDSKYPSGRKSSEYFAKEKYGRLLWNVFNKIFAERIGKTIVRKRMALKQIKIKYFLSNFYWYA